MWMSSLTGSMTCASDTCATAPCMSACGSAGRCRVVLDHHTGMPAGRKEGEVHGEWVHWLCMCQHHDDDCRREKRRQVMCL